MKTDSDSDCCDCGSSVVLLFAVLVLSLTCLGLLCLSMYLHKLNQDSQKSSKKRLLTPSCDCQCKINSFTCLQLKKNKEDTVEMVGENHNKRAGKLKDQRVFQNVQSRPGFLSNSSSGSFRRFEPKLRKLCSKVSLGRSNTISHSSYNSANEELEYDLYDYNHQHIGEDGHEYLIKNSWQVDDFSMTEFAPANLFPSTDTIVNINEVKNCSKISIMKESPEQPRKGDSNKNIIENITSELVSSIGSGKHLGETESKSDIFLMESQTSSDKDMVDTSDRYLLESQSMSDMHLVERHTMSDKGKAHHNTIMLDSRDTVKEEYPGCSARELIVIHTDKSAREETKTMLDSEYVRDNRSTISNNTQKSTRKQGKKSLPPITLIEELEPWDED